MSENKKKNLEILDCTIRDGGYVNDWHFDKVLVREIYRACSKAGVDFVEIGFRAGRDKQKSLNDVGPWRCVSDELISETIAGIKGPQISVLANYGEATIEDFADKKNSPIDLVRVATHKTSVPDAIDLLAQIKKKGYRVSLQLMAYATYTKEEIDDLVKVLKTSEIEYVYVADSYGSVFPDQIEGFLSDLMVVPNIKVGFHPHNNLQMSFANTLEAIRCGADVVDSSFFGMGRGAGNLPTEILLTYLENQSQDKYNSIPVLNVIDQFFVDIKKETDWGYQIPYMLSGMFQLHPSYSKKMVDMREFSVEDILKILSFIQKKDSVGFSQKLLDEVIGDGWIRHLPSNKAGIPEDDPRNLVDLDQSFPKDISYVNRHEGRDFLVLANGPTLTEHKDKIDKFIKKHDPIILGANYIGGLFEPHYHAFYNTRRLIQYVDQVSGNSKLLLGQYIPEDTISDLVQREYETMYYLDTWNHSFDVKDGVLRSNCRTISIFLMGLAIVMGASRIFAVGMDGYQTSGDGHNLFYDEKDEKTDKEMILERHYSCQKFIEEIDAFFRKSGAEGVHILTPTSYKGFYKGIENYI